MHESYPTFSPEEGFFKGNSCSEANKVRSTFWLSVCFSSLNIRSRCSYNLVSVNKIRFFIHMGHCKRLSFSFLFQENVPICSWHLSTYSARSWHKLLNFFRRLRSPQASTTVLSEYLKKEFSHLNNLSNKIWSDDLENRQDSQKKQRVNG